MSNSVISLRSTLPDLEPALIAEMEDKCEINQFIAGESLLRKGQYLRSAIIIVSGLVKVYRTDEKGGEFFMYYLAPGQACALSLLCGIKLQTSGIMAVAVKDTQVLTVPVGLMEQWTMKYKSWINYTLMTYRQRFEELLTTLDHVAFRNMDERLEFYLKRQVEKIGINLSITHQQIADDLHSSREVISRLLKNLERKKMIKLHRNSIEWIV